MHFTKKAKFTRACRTRPLFCPQTERPHAARDQSYDGTMVVLNQIRSGKTVIQRLLLEIMHRHNARQPNIEPQQSIVRLQTPHKANAWRSSVPPHTLKELFSQKWKDQKDYKTS
jgi:hypothetical protein